MSGVSSRRPSPAMVVALVALFVALGGSAYAATKIGTKQLKSGAVTAAKIKKDAVTTVKIKNGAISAAKLQDGAVTGAKVNLATLGTVPSANHANSANSATSAQSATNAQNAAIAATFTGYGRKGIVRANASADAGSEEASRAASPEIPLLSAGPFTVYAKCFLDSGSVQGEIFMRTAEAGSIFYSNEDSLSGDADFFNPDTEEDERTIMSESTSVTNSASYWGVHSPEYTAMSPSGTVVRGDAQTAVKGGNLPGGNGLYGEGNVCLFATEMTQLNG